MNSTKNIMANWILPFIFIMEFHVATSAGPIFMRCYCNLIECINRGDDTCKSRTGCFQELPHYNVPYSATFFDRQSGFTPSDQTNDIGLRYGCLELWPSDSAPFQCTEPGIRKSPLIDNLSGRRRDDELFISDEFGQRIKNGDRSTFVRRRPSSNRHYNKLFESRRWSTYDVPLRCCFGDMCNRRRITSLKQTSNSILPTSVSTTTVTPEPSTTTGDVTSHVWWFTPTMIFISIICGIGFILLVVMTCWILHFQNRNIRTWCGGKNKFIARQATISVKDHYCIGTCTSTRLVPADSLDNNGSLKTLNYVLIETTSELSTVTTGGQRCSLYIPIILSKLYYGGSVSNVSSDAKVLVR